MNKLGEVMLEVSEEWFADLPAPEEVPAYTYSKKYLKWEQEVIYGKKHVTLKRVAKVLLVAAILIIMLAVIALSTTKGREFILNFFNDSAVYNVQTRISDSVKKMEINYIIDGYVLVDEYEQDMCIYNEFAKGSSRYVIVKTPINSKIDFNSDVNSKKVQIDNVVYVVSLTSNGYCNVIWNYQYYSYRVSGNISENEALKVAQSVE